MCIFYPPSKIAACAVYMAVLATKSPPPITETWHNPVKMTDILGGSVRLTQSGMV
jgi:hypothetical protein